MHCLLFSKIVHLVCEQVAEALLRLEPSMRNMEAANLQPMVATEWFVLGLVERVTIVSGADLARSMDSRIAPLAQRWHCLILVAAQAALADVNGFHTDAQSVVNM